MVRSKKRILFGLEFSSGHGHLERLRHISDKFIKEGWHCIFVLKDTWNLFGLDPSCDILPAPKWNDDDFVPSDSISHQNHADILYEIGYGEEYLLQNRFLCWNSILDITKPDMIVGDFSPTLRIAARDRYPICMVGNGFSIPPMGKKHITLDPGKNNSDAPNRKREDSLLRTINAILMQHDRRPLQALADVLNGDRSLVFCLKQFDPYISDRESKLAPPFFKVENPRVSKHSSLAKGRGIFYFPAHHPGTEKAIEVAKNSGLKFDAYISGLSPEAIKENSNKNFVISPSPLDFDQLLSESCLLFHHGGLATAIEGAMAGVGQVIFPYDLEHYLTAKTLEKNGAAVIETNWNDIDIHVAARKLYELSKYEPFMRASQKFASELNHDTQIDVADTTFLACQEILEKPEGING